MLTISRKLTAAAMLIAIMHPAANATTGKTLSWKEQLATAADQLSQSNPVIKGNGTLSSLLAGGSQTLAAGSMANVAGVFQYCVQQKLVTTTNPENIKNQLMDKLGLTTKQEQSEKPEYLEGLAGLLNTRSGQQLDLNTLSNSALGQKVKLKACDIILNQGLSFITS